MQLACVLEDSVLDPHHQLLPEHHWPEGRLGPDRVQGEQQARLRRGPGGDWWCGEASQPRDQHGEQGRRLQAGDAHVQHQDVSITLIVREKNQVLLLSYQEVKCLWSLSDNIQ